MLPVFFKDVYTMYYVCSQDTAVVVRTSHAAASCRFCGYTARIRIVLTSPRYYTDTNNNIRTMIII